MVGFRFDVDCDHVRSGCDEAGEVVIRPGDHEVDVEVTIIGFMDGLNEGRAEGDVVDKVSVHDVEMKPVGAAVDCAGGFISDSSEVGGKEGWGDDPVSKVPLLHEESHREKSSPWLAKKISVMTDVFTGARSPWRVYRNEPSHRLAQEYT